MLFLFAVLSAAVIVYLPPPTALLYLVSHCHSSLQLPVNCSQGRQKQSADGQAHLVALTLKIIFPFFNKTCLPVELCGNPVTNKLDLQ